MMMMMMMMAMMMMVVVYWISWRSQQPVLTVETNTAVKKNTQYLIVSLQAEFVADNIPRLCLSGSKSILSLDPPGHADDDDEDDDDDNVYIDDDIR